jgi:hypothetical protein
LLKAKVFLLLPLLRSELSYSVVSKPPVLMDQRYLCLSLFNLNQVLEEHIFGAAAAAARLV